MRIKLLFILALLCAVVQGALARSETIKLTASTDNYNVVSTEHFEVEFKVNALGEAYISAEPKVTATVKSKGIEQIMWLEVSCLNNDDANYLVWGSTYNSQNVGKRGNVVVFSNVNSNKLVLETNDWRNPHFNSITVYYTIPLPVSNEIGSNDDWNIFCDQIEDGMTYSGQTVKLTADISVSAMAGTGENNSFQGTFDGGGHTLTFTKGSMAEPFGEERCAPFRNTKGATIRNLKVKGDIYTSNKFAAGLVSYNFENANIENCHVSTVIHSSVNGDGSHGGIMGNTNLPVTFKDCIYDGRLLTTNGTTSCGGFMGWCGKVYNNIINSLYAPNPNITMAAGETPINDGGTFVREDYDRCTITDSYYTETMGKAQGTKAYTDMPAGVIVGKVLLLDGNNYYTTCKVSGVGTMYDLTPTASITPEVKDGNQVLTLGTDYTATLNNNEVASFPITISTEGDYTLTLTGKDKYEGAQTLSFKVVPNFSGAGTKADPYMITTTAQLDLLAKRVKDGNTCEGEYFKLANDIAYSYTTAWNDTASTENNYTPIGGHFYNTRHFCGDFDGGSHTISGIRITRTGTSPDDSDLGLFGSVSKGAHIHDIILADARITGRDNVGGIAGIMTNGQITNCHVAATVDIHGIHSNVGAHGGIAGNIGNSTISHCTSAVVITHVVPGLIYGAIAGVSLSNKLSDNLAIGAIVPVAQRNQNCAIAGMTVNTTFERNYYTACTVAGKANATGVGYFELFGKSAEDKTQDDGAVPALRDDANNTNAIALMSALPATIAGQKVTYPVGLHGRTLYKDNHWNTICLPFDLVLAGSVLEGAVARPLSEASITGKTLNLTFGDAVTTLTAGTPYIIKWDGGVNIENPVFYGVTIDKTDRSYDNGQSGDIRVRFLGTYKSTAFDSENKSILLMGGENMLFYPTNGAGIGAQRAYFKIGSDAALARQITAFNINFGEGDETTGIITMYDARSEMSDVWYSLDGRKLNDKPTEKGVYVNNGRKIVIK